MAPGDYPTQFKVLDDSSSAFFNVIQAQRADKSSAGGVNPTALVLGIKVDVTL